MFLNTHLKWCVTSCSTHMCMSNIVAKLKWCVFSKNCKVARKNSVLSTSSIEMNTLNKVLRY